MFASLMLLAIVTGNFGQCNIIIESAKSGTILIYVAETTEENCFSGALQNATINNAKSTTVKFKRSNK